MLTNWFCFKITSAKKFVAIKPQKFVIFARILLTKINKIILYLFYQNSIFAKDKLFLTILVMFTNLAKKTIKNLLSLFLLANFSINISTYLSFILAKKLNSRDNWVMSMNQSQVKMTMTRRRNLMMMNLRLPSL